MKNIKTRNILAAILTLIMLISVFPVSAFAVSKQEINDYKAQRDAIRAQRKEKQAVVDQLENEKAGVLERKRAMDERNMLTIQQMELNAEEIAMYDEMIATEAEKLEEALKLEKQQLMRYRERVRAMEENGNYGFLDMVLKTDSLGELLTVMDDIGEIMQSDRELEEEYRAARENTEKVKAEYEGVKAEIEEKQAVLRQEQEELEKEIGEATDMLKEIQNDLDNRQAEFDEIMAAEEAANAELDRLIAQREKELEAERKRQEEERRRQEAANNSGGGGGGGGGTVVGTGSFAWPTPGVTYCTSRFGPRVHPITGEHKNHGGLDIGASYGTAIHASDGGTVFLAGWCGSYGNCVMIDHGNGYTTVYGHMSSVAVSEGQSVSQNDVIGYVGSTGMSTGPHLHFEVRQNNQRIDPEQFFSGLTFSPSAGV